jgi:hypothetical protein
LHRPLRASDDVKKALRIVAKRKVPELDTLEGWQDAMSGTGN